FKLPGPRTLLKHRRSHLLEHIDNVVARDAVGAEPQRNSRLSDLRNTRDAMSEFSVRLRTVDESRTAIAKHLQVGIFEIDRVNKKRFRAQQAQLRKIFHGTAAPRFHGNPTLSPTLGEHTCTTANKLPFFIRFSDMRCHAKLFAPGEIVNGTVELR